MVGAIIGPLGGSFSEDGKLAKGKLIGWCTRCGGEEINGTRHACRKPMKDAAEMIATKQENERLRDALGKLKTKTDKLRAALSFYADEANYKPADPYTADGEFRAWGKQLNYVPDDKGERARAALIAEERTDG